MKLPISAELPRVKRKGHRNNIVTRQLVEDRLALQYQGLVRIHTDDSVRRRSRSSTVAYTVPVLGLHWSAKMNEFTSSTTAEVIAVKKALRFALSHPARAFMMPCDSGSALQRLAPTSNGHNYEGGQNSRFCPLCLRRASLPAPDPSPFVSSGKRSC